MASTNKTVTLELSQFIATDKPSWLTDYNGDMEKIDTFAAGVGADVSSAKSDAASAKSTAQTASNTAQQAQTAATQAQSTASSAQSTANQAQTAAGQAQTTADNALSIANAAVKNYQYSSTERDTGNKWTNGKTIYEKVLTGTTPSNVNSRNFANIGVNVETFVFICGTVTYNNVTLPMGGPGTVSGENVTYIEGNNSLASSNANTIGFGVSASTLTNKPVTIIVQYTKS